MKIIFTLALMAMAGIALSQQSYLDKNKQKHLIGKFEVIALESDTSYGWFTKNKGMYQANALQANKLKSLLNSKTSIRIFLGTWCGDSKREVPKLIKLLEAMNYKNYELIGTYNTDTLYKVSPQHEEKGLNIFRVPTFIVYKDGKELNRIIEFPKETFEQDLYQILSQQNYTPQYNIANTIDQYFIQNNYSDSIIDKVAKQIKGKTYAFSEINSKAYVELKKGNIDYAIALFRVNTRLYPILDAYDGLAEAYTVKKDDKKATALWQYIAEESNTTNKRALEQLRKINVKP
jgi:thiol-disulfide isomerase/thioredoxin